VTHTVIDPGAVVVHLKDALATLTTVVSSRRFPSFNLLALLAVLNFKFFRLKRCLEAEWDAARVSE